MTVDPSMRELEQSGYCQKSVGSVPSVWSVQG